MGPHIGPLEPPSPFTPRVLYKFSLRCGRKNTKARRSNHFALLPSCPVGRHSALFLGFVVGLDT